MSRKKTDSAIEHRITFGDLERREMREVLTIIKKEKKIQNITVGVKSAAVVGVAGLGVYVGYLGVLAYLASKDEIEDWWQTVLGIPAALWNWQAGSKTCIDPETGKESQCPKTHNGVDNPLSGWPVVGGLFNLGMWTGNTQYLQDLAAGGQTPVGPAAEEPKPSAAWNQYVADNPELGLDPDWMPGPTWTREAAEAAAAAAAAEREAAEEAAAAAAAAAAAEEEIAAQEAAGMPCPGGFRPDLPCSHPMNRIVS